MRKTGSAFKIFIFIAFLGTSLIGPEATLFAPLPAEAKPRLAVRGFANKTDVDVPGSAVTEMMITELYNSGLFSLMERERLDIVADEIRLGQSGLMDPSTAPEVGRIKGAQYTMTGAVTLYHYNASGGILPIPGVGGAGAASRTAYVTLDIRIIDTSTGEVLYAAAEQGVSNQSLGGLVTKYGGFAQGKYGGQLAAATRKAVVRHVENLKEYDWD